MIAIVHFDGTFERHFTPESATHVRGEIADAIRAALADEGETGRWEATVFWHEERQAFSVELAKDGEAIDRRPAASLEAEDYLSWNEESRRARHTAFREYTRRRLHAAQAASTSR